MIMGLAPAPAEDWIELDAHYAEEMAERARLIRDKRDTVLQSLGTPVADAAHVELLEWLRDHLPRTYPDRFRAQGSVVHNLVTGESVDTAHVRGLDAMEAAGRLVQEDFVIMAADGPGQPMRLVSGCVCFPLHWTVLAKLGQSIPEIHDPVPYFNSDIGRFVELFFQKVPAGRIFSRQNWTVTCTPELHMPPGVREAAGSVARATGPAAALPPLSAANAGERLYLRVERQHVQRLPRSGSVLFTIRTFLRPLHEVVAGRPAVAASLASAYRDLPADTLAYKDLAGHKEAALAFLDAAAASGL